MKFFRSDEGRVPLAVIGILLLLISVYAAISLNRADVSLAKSMASSLEIRGADDALLYARADLARVLNYAGMEALRQLGETPVMVPDSGSRYNTGSLEDFQRNWAKAMINQTLNEYILANYMHDSYSLKGFAVNVETLGDWRDVEMEPSYLKLERALSPPLLRPGEDRYASYEAYWTARVPLKVEVLETRSGTKLLSRNITVSTIITSRFPLLRELTEEYSERVNGTNAVMAETTALALAYTWGRGYQQFAKGEPLNIVDNRHLSLIVNGALLLDQGFVYNSADPASLVEYVKQAQKTLRNNNLSNRDVLINTSLINSMFEIDPKSDSYDSTDDAEEARQNYEKAKSTDYNATPIMRIINNKSQGENSQAAQKSKEILKAVYKANIETRISRETISNPGGHDGYPTDMGASSWRPHGEYRDEGLSKTIKRDPDLSPGTLEGEVWRVSFERDHTWRYYYTITVPCGKTTCTVLRWNDITVKDYQYDTVTLRMYAVENSRYSLKLNHRGTTRNTFNDLDGAFQGKTVNIDGSNYDPNLETTVNKYEAQAFTDADKRNAVRTYGLVGSINQLEINEDPSPWVSEAVQKSIDEITQAIEQEVHLSPEVNFENYPVPQDYLREIKKDLISKIKKNQTRYEDKNQYLKGTRYKSAAAKTIGLAREWYVDEIIYQIDTKYSQAAQEIEENLKQNMGAKNASDTENAARNAAQILKNKLYLPLGITMQAYHADEKGNIYPKDSIKSWRENTTLSIDQEPNYLDPDQPYGAKKLYTLKIRNTNLLTPVGINVLPTLDPWITTINAWTINVEGEYVKFQVYDIDNEVHPDPIFGHQPQVYVREDGKIPDPVNDNNFIGSNTRIKFSFNTGTFIAAPPGNLRGVGDKIGDKFVGIGFMDESKGWKLE